MICSCHGVISVINTLEAYKEISFAFKEEFEYYSANKTYDHTLNNEDKNVVQEQYRVWKASWMRQGCSENCMKLKHD